MNKIIFLLPLLLLPLASYGAGPILVDTQGTGQAVLWQDGVVKYNLESGENGRLGTLSNEEAAKLVRELFSDWQVTIDGIETTSIRFVEGTPLGSIDSTNLDDHFTYCPPSKSCSGETPPFILGSARTGVSPIIFDNDGSLTDAVQGKGASLSILGFAGPRVVERVNGVLVITESQAILNGKFINGTNSSSDPEVTLNEFKGAIFHELGHFIGLDHTQVNRDSVVKYLQGDKSEKEAIPTMLPLLIDGEAQLSPHFDDKVAVSLLYPSSSFESSFCRIEGKIFQSNGVTELQGVNVVVSNQSNPLVNSTSFVSGSLYAGSSSGCSAEKGNFILSGLTPGETYKLKIEQISQAFTGGSSIEPCDPPQTGFVAASVPGTFSCPSGGTVIATGTEAISDIVTSKKSSSQTTADAQAGSGGCSLLPH